MIQKFAVVILGAVLFACKSDNGKRQNAFYDFDSLVLNQRHLLLNAHVSINKVSAVNAHSDSVSYVPDSIQWAYELDIFKQLNLINKPVYTDTYKISDESDPFSNLRVRLYSSEKNPPIPFVKVYYFNEFKHLKRIEAVYNEHNVLYTASRSLLMEFEDHEGKPMLSHYKIKGFQKMPRTDTANIYTESKVAFLTSK